MKVWIVEISDFLPVIDSGNRLYRAGMLANALVESGHTVKWWSSTFNHQKRCHRFNQSKTIHLKENYQLRLLHGPGYKQSVSVHRIIHNRFIAREFSRESKEDIKGKPDIIYACLPTLEVSEKAVNYGLQHNIPVVIDIRELWPDNYLTVFPHILRPMLKVLLRQEFLRSYRILHYANAITASSPAYLVWGIKAGKRVGHLNDTWFPLGFPAKSEQKSFSAANNPITLPDGTALPKNSLIITFVGTFTSHVDYDTIISVAREFSNTSPQKVHFLLVGNGDKFELLKRRSHALTNIHLTGWCEKDAVEKLLNMSSIGLAPYKMELKPTLPNKPFEYMSSGLPILSSLGGDLENIIRDESIGLKYCGGDSKDLKKKIEWFLSHPDETKVMGKRAKELFEKKYKADVVYLEFSKYLEKIVMNKVK